MARRAGQLANERARRQGKARQGAGVGEVAKEKKQETKVKKWHRMSRYSRGSGQKCIILFQCIPQMQKTFLINGIARPE